MELRYYPDPILTQKAQPIASIDDDVVRTAHEMLDLMHEKRGIGLAGPQVGYGFRVFVLNLGPKESGVDRVFVNPEILETRGGSVGEEGCLSFPGIYAKIFRGDWVRYRATDLEGKTEEREAEGLEARAILHEYDHLDGVLFTKRMSPAEKQMNSRALRDLEQEWDEQHPEQARAGKGKARARR